MSDEIILYELAAADDTRFSPSCWRTHFGLGHKGLSFKSVRIRFPDIGGLGGPRRTVPVIRIGGTFVEDSWDIAEFLDERFPDRPPLLGCALGRGTSRFVECFTDKVIHPTMLRLVSRDVFDRMDPHDQRYFRRTREGMLRCTLEEAQSYTRSDGARASQSDPPDPPHVEQAALAVGRAAGPCRLHRARGLPVGAARHRLRDPGGRGSHCEVVPARP